MTRKFTYNDEFIDLGEIGEHELQITATNIGRWGEPLSIVILQATAFIRFGEAVQRLDVTHAVIRSGLWLDRVARAYMAEQDEDGSVA